MSKLFSLFMTLWFVPAFGQSILLPGQPATVQKKAPDPIVRPKVTPLPKRITSSASIDFVEFRDASKKNVLMFIAKMGKLKTPSSANTSGEVNLRLENLSWKKLQEAVLSEAIENSPKAR